MAQHDYVSKKHDRLRKRPTGLMLNFMIAIGVVVIVLFIAILYTVKKNKSDNKPISKEIRQTEKPELTLPKKPQERWTYLKQLENPDNNDDVNNDMVPSLPPTEREQILNTFREEKAMQPSTNKVVKNIEIQFNEQKSASNIIKDKAKIIAEGKWFIQCGAFKNKQNAELLKAQITMAGFDSYIQRKTLYRVLIGSYRDKQDAAYVLKQLKESEITNCIVNNK